MTKLIAAKKSVAFFIVLSYIYGMDKNKLFLGFVTAALGLFLLISPETFISFFVIILGVAAVIDGIFILATTRNLIPDPQYSFIVLMRGILSIIIGGLAVVLPLTVAAVVWTVMAYTLAAYFFVSAGLQVYTITKLHRNGIMVRQSMIEVFASVILAVVLIVIPQAAGNFIVRIFGIVLLVVGASFIIVQWKNRPLTVAPDSVETVEDSSAEERPEN